MKLRSLPGPGARPRQPNARATTEDVRRILALRAGNASFKSIALAVGLHPASVARIAQRNGVAKRVVREGGAIKHRYTKPAGLPTKDSAILAYRRAKKAQQKRLAPLLREAKAQLDRQMADADLRRTITRDANREKRRSA